MGGGGAVHFRPDTKGGGGDLVCCSKLWLFTLVPIRKAGKGGVHRSREGASLNTLSKAKRACIRRWRAIVKFTSIAVVELLSACTSRACANTCSYNTRVCFLFFQLYFLLARRKYTDRVRVLASGVRVARVNL